MGEQLHCASLVWCILTNFTNFCSYCCFPFHFSPIKLLLSKPTNFAFFPPSFLPHPAGRGQWVSEQLWGVWLPAGLNPDTYIFSSMKQDDCSLVSCKQSLFTKLKNYQGNWWRNCQQSYWSFWLGICVYMQGKRFCQTFILLGLEGLSEKNWQWGGGGPEGERNGHFWDFHTLLVLLQNRKYLSCGSKHDHSCMRWVIFRGCPFLDLSFSSVF